MSVRRVSRRHAVASGVLFRAVMSASAGVMAWGTAMLVPGGEAHAQTTIWTGATNNLWFTNTNWSPSTVPSGAGTTVSFQGSTNTTVLIGTNTSVGGFRFESASPFTLQSTGPFFSSIDINNFGGNAITVLGSGNATMNARFAVNQSGTVSATGANLTAPVGGIFTSTATVTMFAGTGRTIQWGAPIGSAATGTWTVQALVRLRFTGPGNYTLNSVPSVLAANSAVEVLNGTLTYATGGMNAVTVAGTGSLLRLVSSASLLDRVNVGNGGTLENAAASSIAFPIPVTLDSGRITGTQRFVFNNGLTVFGNGSASPRIDAPIEVLGNVLISSSGLPAYDLELNGPLHGSSLTLASVGGIVTARLMSGTATGSTVPRLAATGNTIVFVDTNSPIAIGGTLAFSGSISYPLVTAGIGRIRATIEHANSFGYSISVPAYAADALSVTSTGAVTFSANTPNNHDFTRVTIDGSLTRSGTSALLAGSLTNNGTLTVNTIGTVAVSGAVSNAGTASVSANGTLSATGGVANPGTFTQSGGFVSANVANSGQFNSFGGTFAGTLTNTGSLALGTAAFSGYYVHASPTAVFSAVGGIVGFSGGANFATPTVLPPGTVIRAAGTLPIVFNADLTFNNAHLNADPGGSYVNNARVQGVGTLSGAGTFTNLRTWTVDSRMSVLPGAVLSNAASFSVTSAGILDLSGGSVTNSGTFSLSDALVTGSGNIVNRAGGLITGSGRISGSVTNLAGATLQPANGTLTTDLPLTNAGLIRVTPLAPLAGAGVIVNTGRIQGDGSIANNINNSGRIEPAGTLALSGPLAIVSTSSVLQLNAGSALLLSSGFSGNQQLGLVSLSGGTLDTNSNPVTNSVSGAINGYGQLLTGGLRNSGSITLAGGTSLVTGAVTNDAARTLRVQAGTAVFNSPVTNNGTISVLAGGYAVFAGSPNSGVPSSGGPGANAVEGTGSTSLAINTAAESDGITQSSLTLASGSVYTVTSREPTAVVSLPGRTAPASLSVLGSISIAPTAFLDLTTNDLIVRNANVASLVSAVATWWNAGARDGTGLGSTSASAADFTTIAVFPNSADAGVSPFYDVYRGTALGPADAVVRFAHLGDTNIDGAVDARDLANLIEGLSTGATGWQNGDLNCDGTVTAADYALFASAYAAYQAGTLPPLGSPGDAGAGQGGVVPEPAAAIFLLAPSAILLGRRRR